LRKLGVVHGRTDNMSVNTTEEKILKKIAELNLATKAELKNILKNDGLGNSDINAVINTATCSLVEKGLISTVNPIGSTCFVITKKGNKLLGELNE